MDSLPKSRYGCSVHPGLPRLKETAILSLPIKIHEQCRLELKRLVTIHLFSGQEQKPQAYEEKG